MKIMKIATLFAYALIAPRAIVHATGLNDELDNFAEERNGLAFTKVSTCLRAFAPRPDPLALPHGLPQGPVARDSSLQAAQDGSDSQDVVPGGGLHQVHSKTFAATGVFTFSQLQQGAPRM